MGIQLGYNSPTHFCGLVAHTSCVFNGQLTSKLRCPPRDGLGQTVYSPLWCQTNSVSATEAGQSAVGE